MNEFWSWFEAEASPKLATFSWFDRSKTFAEMFKYLDHLNMTRKHLGIKRPICIVETGCVRELDDWGGAGYSTVLFDRYVTANGGSVHSVDINPKATELCRGLVNGNTVLYTQDSIEFLKNSSLNPDLLYLDSYDLDATRPLASEAHHLNELNAAMHLIDDETLVVVDDSPLVINEFGYVEVTGKGGLVAKHAFEVAADLKFCAYQVGWTGMKQKETSLETITSDDNIKKLINRARESFEGNRGINASNLYRLILKLTDKPRTVIECIGNGEACVFFARSALRKNKHGLALDWYRKALEVDPKVIEYRLELAIKVLKPLGNLKEARREALISTKIEPNNAKAWGILGDLERDIGNEKATIACYEKQIELAPDLHALINVISVLLFNEDYEKAKKLANKIIETDQKGEGYYCLALIAFDESKHEEAIELFDKALEYGVSAPFTVKWCKSQSLHLIGRGREARLEYNWEILKQSQAVLPEQIRRFPLPLWNNEPPPASIHIHAEAGHGDNLRCSRYLKLLIDKGYDVRYETYEDMVGLMSRSFPEVKIMPQSVDYPGIIDIPLSDYHQPIGWLPRIFETDIDTVPWFGPYLKPDPELVKKYSDLLPKDKLKVGLCWSSGTYDDLGMIKYQRLRSMNLKNLKSLFNHANKVYFVSLQVGPDRSQNNESCVYDLLPDKPDWDETAALVENLDLIISVDTAIAHLAGAMGKPTWLMCLRDAQSWWLMCYRDGASWNESSPWYPSMRIFRQHRFNEPHFWDEVIEDISKELESMTRTKVSEKPVLVS